MHTSSKPVVLDGIWLMKYIKNSDFQKLGYIPATYSQVENLPAKAYDGKVPGNYELDLLRAGDIEDPFFGTNAISMQRMESNHVFYARRFTYTAEENMLPQLVFEGIDTIADIYLNGRLIGHSENMLIPYIIDQPELLEGENELVVHIMPPGIHARKADYSTGHMAGAFNYETLRLRKSPHMFGWDIMPRLISAGIFRPVYINHIPVEHIRQAYLMTVSVDVRKRSARMQFFYDLNIEGDDLSEYTISVKGVCGDSEFEQERRIWFSAGKFVFDFDGAYFWWPKGYGEPNLYHVTVQLKRRASVLDTREFSLGVRTVSLTRTSTSDQFLNGDFHFKVNGERIFILGTNFVPMDAYHSRDRERLPKACELLEDIGCNCIRIWGGNIYEDDYLYDFCDRKGILIWQDFIMACAFYPGDEKFLAALKNEAVAAVRRLRQHPSILLWAGDNECDLYTKLEPFSVDPNRNRATREALRDVLIFEDPTRPYLPSSPYIDENANSLPIEFLSENHLWGPRDYFKSDFFKNSMSIFVSEIGYHGCPGVPSIKKFIPEDEIWPWQNNKYWIAHSTSPEIVPGAIERIDLMARQVRELFGIEPDTLELFAAASQISQAEALKFFIEMFRLSRAKRSGIIWWNLIDGWPQFSDAVVDYYYEKKLAYSFIKNSQQPVLLSFDEPMNWRIQLKAVNDLRAEVAVSYRVELFESGKAREICSGEEILPPDSVTGLVSLPYSHGENKYYMIQWEYNGKSCCNHYVSGHPPIDLGEYLDFLRFYNLGNSVTDSAVQMTGRETEK